MTMTDEQLASSPEDETLRYLPDTITIQMAHAEGVSHASFSSLERGEAANTTTIAANEPFTLPY